MSKIKKPVADGVPSTVDNSTTVQNSQFYGVHWDAKAVSAIQTVADGLVKNAEGLKALAEVFRSQNITVECLLKIGGDK